MAAAQIESPAQQPSIVNCEPEADGLWLQWADGYRSFFHALWLRDCCYCESCGDSYSSKRYIVPSDIPLDIAIKTAESRPTT